MADIFNNTLFLIMEYTYSISNAIDINSYIQLLKQEDLRIIPGKYSWVQ